MSDDHVVHVRWILLNTVMYEQGRNNFLYVLSVRDAYDVFVFSKKFHNLKGN